MKPEVASAWGAVYRFIESIFDAMLAFLRGARSTWRFVTKPSRLGVFFITMALTRLHDGDDPQGIFSDPGYRPDQWSIRGSARYLAAAIDAADTSKLGEVLSRDPAIEAFGSTVGSTTSAKTANNGNFTIVLKTARGA